jgi:hypothetical protein
VSELQQDALVVRGGGSTAALMEGRDHESGSSFIKTGADPRRGEDIELAGASVEDQDFIDRARQEGAAAAGRG